MTSMRELFAVPPKAQKNFIALNVRNVHKKPQSLSSSQAKTFPSAQSRILRESNNRPNERSASKTSSHNSCSSNLKHRPKAYRNAGCQTIDLDLNESLLEDGVIRYPSSKWKEKSTQDHQFKSIALQTESKFSIDIPSGAESSQCEEVKPCRSEADDASDTCKRKEVVVEEVNHVVLDTVPADIRKKCSTATKYCTEEYKKELRTTKQSVENRQTNVSTGPQVLTRHKRGTIPKYLIEQKLQKEREQRKILDEAERTGILDPDCPPGHILLPTEKRLEQLDFLKKNYRNLINELNRFPVRNDSLKLRQRRVLMEKELDKLEEGIKLFSKEKLFVKP